MVSRRSQSTFALVPTRWFESVVGLWTVLLAVLGLELAFAGAERLLRPPEAIAWIGFLVTIVVAGFGYGVFAFGATAVYRRLRGFDPLFAGGLGGRRAWAWVGGLGGMAVGLIGATAVVGPLVGHPDGMVAPVLAASTPPMFEFPFGLGLAGVNDVLNSAPYVLFVALLGGLLMGPAVAALVHGILQDVLARVLSPEIAVGATAVGAALLLENSAFTSVTTPHEAISAGVVLCFVGAVAYAYRETDRLVVPMAAYGLFNVLGVLLAWADLLASLYAGGHLFG